MRSALVILCAVGMNGSLLQRAWAGEVCAWIVESVEDDGTHNFELNLSADAPAAVAARFEGPGFLSGAMGGDLIQLEPGEPKNIDGEGFDVSAGDDLAFNVQLFDHALASLDEVRHPTATPLATFDFRRKVGEAEHAPPPDLAARQCRPLG